jgi:hypothetical protein
MDPYYLLIALALVLVATVAVGIRLVMNGLRARREAEAAARRTGSTAADYYVRTLQQAAEVVGGEENLAGALNVPPELLRGWLAGESMPIEVHLAALDLVTRGTPHEKAE